VFHYDNVAALGSQVRRRAVPEAQPRDTDCVGAENVVKDHRGQKLAYVYFEDGPGRQTAADPLTQDEARRIAANIAKLPDLLKKEATMTPPGTVPAPKR
jgi:hypothetical protein